MCRSFAVAEWRINRDFPFDAMNGAPTRYNTSFYLNDLLHFNVLGRSLSRPSDRQSLLPQCRTLVKQEIRTGVYKAGVKVLEA
jgi:hypothetical protein